LFILVVFHPSHASALLRRRTGISTRPAALDNSDPGPFPPAFSRFSISVVISPNPHPPPFLTAAARDPCFFFFFLKKGTVCLWPPPGLTLGSVMPTKPFFQFYPRGCSCRRFRLSCSRLSSFRLFVSLLFSRPVYPSFEPSLLMCGQPLSPPLISWSPVRVAGPPKFFYDCPQPSSTLFFFFPFFCVPAYAGSFFFSPTARHHAFPSPIFHAFQIDFGPAPGRKLLPSFPLFWPLSLALVTCWLVSVAQSPACPFFYPDF